MPVAENVSKGSFSPMLLVTLVICVLDGRVLDVSMLDDCSLEIWVLEFFVLEVDVVEICVLEISALEDRVVDEPVEDTSWAEDEFVEVLTICDVEDDVLELTGKLVVITLPLVELIVDICVSEGTVLELDSELELDPLVLLLDALELGAARSREVEVGPRSVVVVVLLWALLEVDIAKVLPL